ncbi:hypothetical protein SLU01_21010 [Sporosarcina luteola]|uniref:Uncharacterized protein n=1 Tax=Sporosarcina luteola TaxID=582850 RepID=A0A511Z8L5_9BACL|nr:hypothetical protein SLU01_21010 [Sporosarcina luteola]
MGTRLAAVQKKLSTNRLYKDELCMVESIVLLLDITLHKKAGVPVIHACFLSLMKSIQVNAYYK